MTVSRKARTASLTLTNACSGRKAPVECRWVGLGVSGSGLHCISSGNNSVSQHPGPWRGQFAPATVEEALTEEKTISHYVSQTFLKSLSMSKSCAHPMA